MIANKITNCHDLIKHKSKQIKLKKDKKIKEDSILKQNND